jgi:hypothetical protein
MFNEKITSNTLERETSASVNISSSSGRKHMFQTNRSHYHLTDTNMENIATEYSACTQTCLVIQNLGKSFSHISQMYMSNAKILEKQQIYSWRSGSRVLGLRATMHVTDVYTGAYPHLYIQKSKQLHNTIQLAIDNLRTTT